MAAGKRFVQAVITAFVIIGIIYINLLTSPLPIRDAVVRDTVRSLSVSHSVDQSNATRRPSPTVAPTKPWKWEGLAKESCTYVEDICHSSHRWFYRTDPAKVQPNATFVTQHRLFRQEETAYRPSYQFEHIDSIPDTCIESPISNHLVLFSIFNEMLGEFYGRGLLFLWFLSQQVDWLKPAQLYLHLYQPSRSLLDSHHLFTSPFRSHPLLDFTTLLDETPCTCLPRLILCGYAESSTVDPTDGHAVTQWEPDPSLTRQPLRDHGTQDYHHFRNTLLQSMIHDNARVQNDIRSYRETVLQAHGVDPLQRHNWRLVGLSQRNGRRKWLQLPHVMAQTRAVAFQHQVVLVEVNVEDKTSSSYQQIVRHAALDALIGIHGAQLTEAIWMTPHSWVVELLPYVPDGIIMGGWTRQTTKPTPLGVIYDNTDLNHVGYILPRESAPYCYDQDDTIACWRQNRHPWDDRDFQLEPTELAHILATYILPRNLTQCQDLVDRGKDDFVLYNVNCVDTVTTLGTNATVTPHHYYRAMPKKTRQPGEPATIVA